MIVAANQAVTGPDYPYRLADWLDYGYRSKRIHDLLRAGLADGSKLRVADMAEIQNDTRNPMAPVLVPYLLDVLLPSAYYASGQQLLSGWDHDAARRLGGRGVLQRCVAQGPGAAPSTTSCASRCGLTAARAGWP